MKKLKTKSNVFDIEWAAPVSITENIVFLAKIINSDMNTVHSVFQNPDETVILEKTIENDNNETTVDTYENYTRYFGFSIDTDGGIIVTLKRS